MVLAASYEARAYGVPSAMGGAQARRLCPHAVVVPPRMSAYAEASTAVFAVFEQTTPLVEGLSIDEAFLDVGGLGRISGTPSQIAVRLRRAFPIDATGSVALSTRPMTFTESVRAVLSRRAVSWTLREAVMTVWQFVAHKSPGKSRVFALVRGQQDSLEAVTTLGADDLHLTENLVRELNVFLAERRDETLAGVLDQVPDAVHMAVSTFLRQRCSPELGAFSVFGSIEILRQVYFDDETDDFEDYLAAAYMIGLGVRVTNEIQEDRAIGWSVELRTAEAFVPASAEPRTWSLPDGVPVLSTWTSQERTAGNPVTGAVAVAKKAAAKGRWVRLHTLEHGEGDNEFDGGSVSEFVVDVFDAPIPRAEADSDE